MPDKHCMRIIIVTLIFLTFTTITPAIEIGGGAGGGNKSDQTTTRIPATSLDGKNDQVENRGMVNKIMRFFRTSSDKPDCSWANSNKTEVICNNDIFRKSVSTTTPHRTIRSN